MTEIVLYSGVADPITFATRLTMKLFDEGRRVRLLTLDEEMTEQLDRLLWTHVQGSFVPHCRLSAAIALDTPVWVDHAPTHPGEAKHADVLINLAPNVPEFAGRFARVADVVGVEESAVAAGRGRFKKYKADGYAMTHHDMTGKV
jgi:DNA polymerase III subunit chi